MVVPIPALKDGMEQRPLHHARLWDSRFLLGFGFNGVVERWRRNRERHKRCFGDQRFPVLPSSCFGFVLGLVYLPSVEIVPCHEGSRLVAPGDVERHAGRSNFLPSKQSEFPNGIQSLQHDGGDSNRPHRVLFPLLFLESGR